MNLRLRQSKKADWIDYIFGSIMLIVIAIVIIIGKVALTNVATEINATSGVPDNAKQTLNTLDANFVGLWDSLFAFLFIGLYIAMIISAFFIRSNPIFYIILISILGVFSIINLFMADFFHELMSSPEFSGVATQFAKTGFLVGTKFPLFMLGFGILLGIVLYAKGGVGSEGL